MVLKVFVECKDRRLVGYSNGKQLYEEQLKDKLLYKYKTTIVFPISVEDISLSYINGIMEGVYKNITKGELRNYIEIDGSDRVKYKFDLYFLAF